MSETGMQVTWFRRLLEELKYPQGTAVIREDNQGSIAMLNSTGYHCCTCHIDIGFHFIKELVDKSIANVEYITTKDMVADVRTKGVGRDSHACLRTAMGVLPNFQTQGTVGVNGTSQLFPARASILCVALHFFIFRELLTTPKLHTVWC